MDLEFRDKNDFLEFKRKISNRLKNRIKGKSEKADTIPSAVMIILMNKDNLASVFLTKRTQKVRTHKGQISFPGGAREENDITLLDTALRETYEETGIKPNQIEVIGEFDEYISITNFHVSTFVGVLDYPYKCKINRNEIEKYMEVPLSIFYNKEFNRVEYCCVKNTNTKNYYYSYKDFSIWGLTAKILTDFADKILH